MCDPCRALSSSLLKIRRPGKLMSVYSNGLYSA